MKNDNVNKKVAPSEYYMLCSSNHRVSKWERCKAKTFLGAKREASGEFSGQLLESVLSVGVKQSCGRIAKLASKALTESKWHDFE